MRCSLARSSLSVAFSATSASASSCSRRHSACALRACSSALATSESVSHSAGVSCSNAARRATTAHSIFEKLCTRGSDTDGSERER
eukprot:6286356-Prymnesium_polylepis.1